MSSTATTPLLGTVFICQGSLEKYNSQNAYIFLIAKGNLLYCRTRCNIGYSKNACLHNGEVENLVAVQSIRMYAFTAPSW